MKRDEALTILTAHRAELAAFGLRRLALFGSVARDEAGPDSDVDVLVEFEGEPTLKRYAGLYDCLEHFFPCPVDMATPDMLRPFMHEAVEEDAYEVVPGLKAGPTRMGRPFGAIKQAADIGNSFCSPEGAAYPCSPTLQGRAFIRKTSTR